MPDKYHYGFDLGNGKDESCLTIFRDEEGDTQVVEAVLYGKQAEAVLACLRSRDEQHRRDTEERRKSQVIVELYNDGKWWCVNGPGCDDLACVGHDTFKDWYMAVKTGVKLVADFRASQLGSKEEKGEV